MKRYGVILADPPWKYNQPECKGTALNHYSTMSLAELAQLSISQLAADNCILLLWSTWPKLDEMCLPLLKIWGFEYVTGFPWVKITSVALNLWNEVQISVPYGVGYWARGTTELLLIGRRGNVSPPTNGFIGLLSPNLYHSRKPDSIYEYAESLPGPYLELFARRKRDGWDTWGNETDNTANLGIDTR
jgi:site-specific DNA-methyltransferase (adenine-specific)